MERHEYFLEALSAMDRLYGQDVPMTLATAQDNHPNARVVDVYFTGGAFYATTHLASAKMREIAKNPCVALNHQLFVARGIAEYAGHPLDAGNEALRGALAQAFHKFYSRHVNERDPGTCILKITPSWALVFADGFKYIADFEKKTATRQLFTTDIIL